ncbi:MAG: hypothetical protein AB7I33_09580 [Gemmatimonadales bacterium]
MILNSFLNRPWFKKIGITAFLFFLLKGLLWLVVPTTLTLFGCFRP